MKKGIIFGLMLVLNFVVFAQIKNPIKWKTSVEKVSNTEYDLIACATIKGNWHTYSQYRFPKDTEEGPVATLFTFKKSDSYSLINEVLEGKGSVEFSKPFGVNVKYFINKAVFAQRIKLKNKGIKTIKATVFYMACNDEQCLPPEEDNLVFDLTKKSPAKTYKTLYSEPKIRATTHFSDVQKSKNNNIISKNEVASTIKKESVKKKTKNNNPENKRLLGIFLIAFLSGFAALLTPCVFPMIPMTVSFFTKQSKNKSTGIKNAIIYGISIIVIYVLLGSGVTAIFGADSLNALSTNVWFNLIFFLLLVIFAFSFLGAFEITLPSSWITKVDAQADRRGFIGIFFMALALAVVSFSCTGPIVGTLLVQSATQGGLAPIVGMFGFSLAIALPFTLFAAFPGWLNSLPKSGGWLNTIKVFLGFLELALAFKFLSNADLVLQAHYLERELFIAIWIVIFSVLGFYLFGKIRLPHDSPTTHISIGRLSLGLLVLSFTVYLIPGLWGAPLKLISGFPPPMHYSESPNGIGGSISEEMAVSNVQLPEGSKRGEYNIVTFTDYKKGLAYAKKVNKPVMIDFTGHACVNCRKMEQRVWSDPKVLKILKNDVIMISLYVDDKRPLPKNEQVTSKLKPGKKLKYIGQKWSEFQTLRYKSNSQPMYVLMDHQENNLIAPQNYNPDAESYLNWLKTGIRNFISLNTN